MDRQRIGDLCWTSFEPQRRDREKNLSRRPAVRESMLLDQCSASLKLVSPLFCSSGMDMTCKVYKVLLYTWSSLLRRVLHFLAYLLSCILVSVPACILSPHDNNLRFCNLSHTRLQVCPVAFSLKSAIRPLYRALPLLSTCQYSHCTASGIAT